EKEKAAGHSNIVNIDKSAATVSITDPRTSNAGADPPKTFTFDSVFDWTCTQTDVYNTTARPIVESVLAGYNGTIFAYGQTGTGKTFSMEGVRDVPELRGIIPNAFEHIFAEIALAGPGTQFLVRASYLEIYNEDIRDLLNPKAGKLEIKERADSGIYVKDLRTFVIKDVAEMDRLMGFGNSNRSVGATEMNAHSSRSHSIFSITVEASEATPDGEAHIRAGKLHLVDLAGSERQSKTGATGDRLKEATKINLSLSALGNVISALVDGKSSHIPYRDSKLTRLLQDSLGGNARTLMVATLSPASYNFDESVSTLRYANRAKSIKNKPKINEDPKDAMLREFQEEIKRLKAQLESIDTGGVAAEPIIQEIEEIEEMQAQVEREKQLILESKDLEESERNRLLAEREARAAELAAEREARESVAAKLAQLEQKLLVGGVNMIDKNESQQIQLARRAQDLEERARKERELTRELEEHDETNLQIEEEFSSLQEEAAAKTRKLKKLWNLLMAHKSEIKDLQAEHQREREDLLDTIRDLTRELKLRMLVISSFTPAEEQAVIEQCADYDEAAEKWRIAHIAHAGNNIRGKRSLVSGQPLGPALHRDQFGAAGAGADGGEEAPWDPMCVFPDVYLAYDVPTASSKKKSGGVEVKKVDRSPVRKARPASAARKSPTKGVGAGGAKERVSSRSGSGRASGVGGGGGLAGGTDGSVLSLGGKEDHAAPAARGLVGKNKHYA
ncbi:P-loop containing nucleoside triphosphate hydrolase protein, partial [Blyttiomyces helicus]